MRRRDFLKAGGTVAVAEGVPYVPAHNYDKYDFGPGPQVADRLNQGPFPADLYPIGNVVMDAAGQSHESSRHDRRGAALILGPWS